MLLAGILTPQICHVQKARLVYSKEIPWSKFQVCYNPRVLKYTIPFWRHLIAYLSACQGPMVAYIVTLHETRPSLADLGI